MDRHGLVARQRRSRTKTEGTPLSEGFAPNALWCTDYKGEFMLEDKRYCHPLTVSDYASRYLLLCEAMESVKEQGAFTAFERLFKEGGLPHAIRSDNGVPFASPNTRNLRWAHSSICSAQSLMSLDTNHGEEYRKMDRY